MVSAGGEGGVGWYGISMVRGVDRWGMFETNDRAIQSVPQVAS